MTLIFLSHLAWGNPSTFSNYPGCSDRSDVSMVAEPNEPKCGDIYPYLDNGGDNQTKNATWNWFLCKTTNTCIHEDARLECVHLIIQISHFLKTDSYKIVPNTVLIQFSMIFYGSVFIQGLVGRMGNCPPGFVEPKVQKKSTIFSHTFFFIYCLHTHYLIAPALL